MVASLLPDSALVRVQRSRSDNRAQVEKGIYLRPAPPTTASRARQAPTGGDPFGLASEAALHGCHKSDGLFRLKIKGTEMSPDQEETKFH